MSACPVRSPEPSRALCDQVCDELLALDCDRGRALSFRDKIAQVEQAATLGESNAQELEARIATLSQKYGAQLKAEKAPLFAEIRSHRIINAAVLADNVRLEEELATLRAAHASLGEDYRLACEKLAQGGMTP